MMENEILFDDWRGMPEKPIDIPKAKKGIPSANKITKRLGQAMMMNFENHEILSKNDPNPRFTFSQDEMEQIFRWFARWARTLQATGVYGVDDFADIDRSFIRSWIGRLTKRESLAAIF
jgi:hypothetical protein